MSMSDGIETVSCTVDVEPAGKSVKLTMHCHFKFVDRLNHEVTGTFQKTLPKSLFDEMVKENPDWASGQSKVGGWTSAGPTVRVTV